MAIERIEKFKFRVQRLQSSLGLFGWIGVLTFVIGGLILWYTHLLAVQIPGLSKELSKKREISNSEAGSHIVASTKLELPVAAEYERILKNIVLLTEKNTVTLVGGSYSVKALQTSKVKIIEITFPLSGTYLQIKHLLAELLNTVPNSSVQVVRISQSNRTSEILDVEAVILLYFLESASK